MRTPEDILRAKAAYNTNLLETELSSLPEGYIQGGGLTITLGDVVVKPLIANILGKQVSRPNPTNIADMKWTTLKLNNTTFYIYINRLGFFFVETIPDEVVNGRYGTYNPRTLDRFIGKVYVNSSGFYITTELVGIQIVGYSGEGSNNEPKEGDRRVFIDEDEIGFEEYTGGDWSTVNSIKLGGVDSSSLFYPFLQCQGVLNPLADEISVGDPLPTDQFRHLTFETNYADQNGNTPDLLFQEDRSVVWSKFGDYSFFSDGATGASAYLEYDDLLTLTDPIGFCGWVYMPKVSTMQTIYSALYDVDGSNQYIFSLFWESGGGGLISANFVEIISGSPVQNVRASIVVPIATMQNTPHLVGSILDIENLTIAVVVDSESNTSSISALTLSGSSSSANRSRINTIDSPSQVHYLDDVIFAIGEDATTDLFIQHYNHNVPWNADYSAKDIIIKPATGGRVVIDDNSGLTDLPSTYDIASTNYTHTLPAITGTAQKESFYWTGGDGSNKVTLAVTGTPTVGGISAGTWLGEGDGHMVVESDGTNWQVREYEDYLIIANSGNNINRTILKQLNGIAIVKGTLVIASLAMTTATAGLFQSAASQVASFGYTMVAAPTNMLATANSQAAPINATATPTQTTISIRFYRGNSATAGVQSRWEANPRWRT